MLRLTVLLGVLLSEMGLIILFIVLPELHTLKYSPPDGHWENEFPHSPWLSVVALVMLGLFITFNAGLILVMWRTFNSRNE